jgi:hypothetical protein
MSSLISFSYSSESSQPFRRAGGGVGPGGGTRQTSEGWRRSRGDDDDANEQNDDVPPVNGSTTSSLRSGPSRRGGSTNVSGSMEQRTKSNEKWNRNDDRPGRNLLIDSGLHVFSCSYVLYLQFDQGPSNSYESNQTRSSGGWRTNATASDRDMNLRRPQAKRDRSYLFVCFLLLSPVSRRK